MLKTFRLIILLMVLFSSAAAEVSDEKSKGRFSFYLENDLFAGTDRDYTSGMKLTWISPSELPENRPGFQNVVSISFGQNIYTPADITRNDLIPDDRPYAGITYIGFGYHSKRKNSMASYELDIGILGPHSYAEDFQKVIHKVFGGDDPLGWNNQLKNELVLDFIFDQKWKMPKSEISGRLEYDSVVHLGGSLGNVKTAASTGVEFRTGWNIPDDFGTFLIHPGGESTTFSDGQGSSSFQEQLGFYIFASFEGHAVLRNIFLDGNTFKASHSVEKNMLVADIVAGVALMAGRFKLSYAYVYRTKQFKTQKRNQIFGAINVSFSYGL